MNIQEYIQGGAIESYVLGLADEEDIAELQRLRIEHPEIAAAVEAAENRLLERARAQAVPAPTRIRTNLLQMIKTEPAEPASPPSIHRLRALNRYKALAAASVLLLVTSLVYNYYLHRNYIQAVAEYTLISNPSVLKVPLLGVAGKENAGATLYWDATDKFVYLDAVRLPKAPAGKQYQLWALVDGKPVDAGLLENISGIRRLKSVQKAQAFAITLEKTGGSPTPTLSEMVVLGNVRS
ncbi:MAG TPA: anti-sigma factor [Puia sp.]|uniref:anti-sigma factor n=1 Tax=Puia sp. TaxID=2045100 RepID=UPI002BBDC296|nr:anti-sigma factor [Puia sp.]HVU97918.1 anti-sigma factor [Puia sp.]